MSPASVQTTSFQTKINTYSLAVGVLYGLAFFYYSEKSHQCVLPCFYIENGPENQSRYRRIKVFASHVINVLIYILSHRTMLITSWYINYKMISTPVSPVLTIAVMTHFNLLIGVWLMRDGTLVPIVSGMLIITGGMCVIVKNIDKRYR